MLCDAAASIDDATSRTSARFGHLWEQSAARSLPSSYHFEKMAAALDLPGLATGLTLDAGCGEGIDLVNRARTGESQIIGVELSEGGCDVTFARIATLPRAHVVQADLRQLPFAPATFDHIYSYGVLHHIPSPLPAARELARVARSDAHVSVYLYEDFGERSTGSRWALKIVNALRPVTTSLPPRLLYAICRAASPAVYLLLSVPHQLLMKVSLTREFAAGLPYRHAAGPFAIVGDLYDRFSAPVEYRYSRRGAAELLASAGFRVMRVEYERGWMVHARGGPRLEQNQAIR
jgi:SAM-dependent methyltransferase